MWQFILRPSFFLPPPMPSFAKPAGPLGPGGPRSSVHSVAERCGVRALPSRATGVWRAPRISAPTSAGTLQARAPPLRGCSGRFCLPLDWDMDPPGYGRGPGQLCGPSLGAAWYRPSPLDLLELQYLASGEATRRLVQTMVRSRRFPAGNFA